MIRIPQKPKPAPKGMTPPKAPMYPAKVWGETCAERLFDLMPRARGELILQDMERWEGEFRDQYSDWPEQGVERAVKAFKDAYRSTWERLSAEFPVKAKGIYADE